MLLFHLRSCLSEPGCANKGSQMMRLKPPLHTGSRRWAAAAILVLAGVSLSEAQTKGGRIQGYVFDPTQAVIPGVTVTATDQERDVERETVTSRLGKYVFSHVMPGLYTLRFEAEGFLPYVAENFEVRVGETAAFSPELTLGTAAQSIVVSAVAERPAIDTHQTAQADHIDSVRIENLPINRRDYLDLALLTPGVVDTNHMVDDRDSRIAVTPHSGLGIGGGSGRNNVFMLDGLNNVLDTGTVRSTVAQAAVQEFQVNRNTFSAELGGAPGGAVNIVTKGGTSQLHGSLFGLLRHRSVQARNFFDPEKSAYTRAQSGASIGGPLGREGTFFYGAYERLDRHESVFVPLLQNDSFLYELTPSQQALMAGLSTAGLFPAPLLSEFTNALTPGNYPHVVSLFEQNSGVFPFGEERQQFLGRIDHTVGDGHTVFTRVNWTGSDSENTQFGSLVSHSRGRNSHTNDFGLALGNTLLINPELASETLLGVNYHDFGVFPTDPYGPSIDINGFGLFGRDLILPARIVERAGQVRQNFTRTSGPHTYKFGADVGASRFSVRSETFFGGRFQFGEAVPLSSIIDSGAGIGTAQLLQGALTQFGQPGLAAAVDEPISALQAYGLGLPLIYQQGFGNPYWIGWKKHFNYFAEASWRLRPNFQLTLGGRHEFEVKTNFPTDKNNFAPRLGFAWSPDPRMVIRGGFGIYYARIDSHITYIRDLLGVQGDIFQVFIPLTGLAGINSALTGQLLTSADIYETVLRGGILGTRSITPQDLAIHGVNPGPGLPLRVQFDVADDTVNPYSQQGSLEIQREVADGYTVSLGYNFNRGVHIIRPLDRNVYQAGTNELGRPIVGFHNPLVLQDNIYGSWADSSYHAFMAQFRKRFFDGFTLSAHYTWSKTMDENTDYNSSFQPHLQWDAKAEWALSSFHRKHNFVTYTVVDLPWRSGTGRGFGHALIRDFTVSAILSARSGAPFNLNSGFDTVGDRHTDTHRPWGLGRNVGIGPDFFSVDLRLNREIPLTENWTLGLIAEAFNLLNRTNFKHVNSTVGDMGIDELPSRLVGRPGPATEPFSFTSAFDPRQFQLSLRLNF